MKKKIITVLGTRPEIIRLSSLIKKLDSLKEINHILVHTGQNDDPQLKDTFFQDLTLRSPDYTLSTRHEDRSLTLDAMRLQVKKILIDERPDLFLLLGDTDSGLTALEAHALHIPIVHLEAGNRCFDPRSPEEINRKIIDRLATINMPYSDYGKKHLLDEGINTMMLITGSPLREVVDNLLIKIHQNDILQRMHLDKRKYIIWSTHRAEHIDDDTIFTKAMNCLNEIAHYFSDQQFILTIHPRMQKKIDQLNFVFSKNILFYKPFGIIDYLTLQVSSKIVLSDSGSLQEEADILGFHGVHLRRQHERQEAEAIPVTFLSEFNANHIIDYINKATKQEPKNSRVGAYLETHFSDKVANYLVHYLNNQR